MFLSQCNIPFIDVQKFILNAFCSRILIFRCPLTLDFKLEDGVCVCVRLLLCGAQLMRRENTNEFLMKLDYFEMM